MFSFLSPFKYYIYIAFFLALVGIYSYFTLTIKSLETEISNNKIAIETYEGYMKVLPFDTLTKERKDKTHEEIYNVIHYDYFVIDGNHSL